MALGNKEIMANNIKRLLLKNGKEPKDMITDLDFKTATVYDWLSGKSYPRIDKIELMAQYFRVDKSDLVEDPTNNPFKSKDDKQPIDLNEIANNDSWDEYLSADGHPLSDKDKQVLRALFGD